MPETIHAPITVVNGNEVFNNEYNDYISNTTSIPVTKVTINTYSSITPKPLHLKVNNKGRNEHIIDKNARIIASKTPSSLPQIKT